MQHIRAGACRGCGAALVWIPTPGGKSMPCDAEQMLYRTRAGAKGKIVTPNGQVLSADIGVQPEQATGVGYVPHWATCPEAGKFRRTRT